MAPRNDNRPLSPDEQDDLAFAQGIARGEAAAMRRAVDTFLPPVYAVARRMLRNEADAEEVAQETFLRVWKHAGRWSPQGARLSTWATRIAVNLCYDRLRKPMHGRSAPMDEAPEPADEAPLATDTLMAGDRAATLEEAMSALPERQRAAIVLVHLEEMSNIDAAAVMEVSVEALESLLARGRRGLKKALAPKRDELLGEVS